MPKITAWKCPHTGTLFEHENQYRAHLRKLSNQRARVRKYIAFQKTVDAVIEGEKKCNNVQELCEYVIEHSKEYMTRGILCGFDGNILRNALENGWNIEWPKFTGMKIYTSRWSKTVSNTHSAPRGKKTNWGGREPDVPRGYPGWRGNIRIWHDEDANIVIHAPGKKRPTKLNVPSFSDCTHSLSGINTGTGGGLKDGSYHDVKLFAEDFPEMEKIMIFKVLQGPDENIKQAGWHYNERFPTLDAMGEGRTGHVVDGDPF